MLTTETNHCALQQIEACTYRGQPQTQHSCQHRAKLSRVSAVISFCLDLVQSQIRMEKAAAKLQKDRRDKEEQTTKILERRRKLDEER